MTATITPILPACDCLNHCGDDPAIQEGRAQVCEARRQRDEADRVRAAAEASAWAIADRVRAAAEASAWAIADRACAISIESYGCAERIDGLTWYDTRPMLSEHEHSTRQIDQFREELAHALWRGVAIAHPQRGYLLRILQPA